MNSLILEVFSSFPLYLRFYRLINAQQLKGVSRGKPRLEIHPRKRLGLLNIRWGGSIIDVSLSSINFAGNRGERLLLLTTGTVLAGPTSSGILCQISPPRGVKLHPSFHQPLSPPLLRGGWSGTV